MAEEVKLFRTWSSPYALRIVWALQLKGIQYETVLEDVFEKSELVRRYNPVHKKVPVLLHDGRPIAESLIILEYIDETWKQHPLLPLDPYARAMARFWAQFGDDKVTDQMSGSVCFCYAPCTRINVDRKERVTSIDFIRSCGFREVEDNVTRSIQHMSLKSLLETTHQNNVYSKLN